MTATATTSERVQRLAWKYGAPVENDLARNRMYVRTPRGTFWAPLPEVVVPS